MSQIVPVETIITHDGLSRPQSNHISLAENMGALFEDRASEVVIDHIRRMGQGDPRIAETRRPIMSQMLTRVVDSLAVLYVQPPTRRLMSGGTTVPDDRAASRVFRDALSAGMYAETMRLADAWRSLYSQVIVSFAEDSMTRSVMGHLYSPDRAYRMRSKAGASSSLEGDDWILLQTEGPRFYSTQDGLRYQSSLVPGDKRYRFQAWKRTDDGRWLCWICDGNGNVLLEETPYGESGETPFGTLPMVLIQDRLSPEPWLPISESRISFAMSVNGALNDLAYLITQEAHSRYVLKSDSTKPPTDSGPGETVHIQTDEDMDVLSAQPKISEAIATLETILQNWSVSESIPVESLLRKRGDLTGDAIVASERDLENRRQKKRALALRTEHACFAKFVAVYNAMAPGWGLAPLPSDSGISVHLGRAWQAKTPREKQEMILTEMAAGLASVIDYYQAMHGVDRAEAIELYSQTQADRELYPILHAQPPGALLSDNQHAPLGDGSATRVRGEFHPDVAGSTEGASVVSAARAANEES